MDTPPDPQPSPVQAVPSGHGEDRSAPLVNAAVRLLAILESQDARISTQRAKLDLLIHDAQAKGHRRADFNRRDRAVYRLGGAFEPVAALDLDDVQLVGLLAAGQVGVLLLAKAALDHPTTGIAALLRIIFHSKAGAALRAHGVYCRWHWLQALYREETEAFLATPKGRDPGARWRTERPTKNQVYLAGEISRLLQIVSPRFEDRGAAFDWIRNQGGNPRFWQAPPIDISQFGELFS